MPGRLSYIAARGKRIKTLLSKVLVYILTSILVGEQGARELSLRNSEKRFRNDSSQVGYPLNLYEDNLSRVGEHSSEKDTITFGSCN